MECFINKLPNAGSSSQLRSCTPDTWAAGGAASTVSSGEWNVVEQSWTDGLNTVETQVRGVGEKKFILGHSGGAMFHTSRPKSCCWATRPGGAMKVQTLSPVPPGSGVHGAFVDSPASGLERALNADQLTAGEAAGRSGGSPLDRPGLQGNRPRSGPVGHAIAGHMDWWKGR